MSKISDFTISERDSKLLSRTRIHSKKRKTWKGRRRPTVDQERAELDKRLELARNLEDHLKYVQQKEDLDNKEYETLIKTFLNQLGRVYRPKATNGNMPHEKYKYKHYFNCPVCEDKYDQWKHHIRDSPICEDFE